jgi:hypothetical protein
MGWRWNLPPRVTRARPNLSRLRTLKPVENHAAAQASRVPVVPNPFALTREGTTTYDRVDQSASHAQRLHDKANKILRERISTSVVVDILELF